MNIIEKFFGAKGAQDFLEKSWPAVCHVQDGPLGRLGEIADVPEFHNIELMLENIDSHVDLVYSNGKREIIPKPLDALDKYRSGAAMLYLKNVEKFPAIYQACDELSKLLSIPRHHISCEAFAATGAVDVPVHFDHETNFMIQIRGDKTWKFAENISLPHPTFPYFPGNPNRFYDNGKNPFNGDRLPSEIPSSHVERVVHAGTVTFMPRGYWHSTRTHEESFAIGFVINPPTFAEIFVSKLVAELHTETGFREHPIFANTADGRSEIISRFKKIFNSAIEIIEESDAESMLNNYIVEVPGNVRPLNHPR